MRWKPASNKYRSSAIIDHLQKQLCTVRSSAKSAVAFYYFSFSDPAKQSVRNFVCSVLLQVVQNQVSIPTSLRFLYGEYQVGQPPLSRLLDCFRSVVSGISDLFCDCGCLGRMPGTGTEKEVCSSRH